MRAAENGDDETEGGDDGDEGHGASELADLYGDLSGDEDGATEIPSGDAADSVEGGTSEGSEAGDRLGDAGPRFGWGDYQRVAAWASRKFSLNRDWEEVESYVLLSLAEQDRAGKITCALSTAAANRAIDWMRSHYGRARDGNFPASVFITSLDAEYDDGSPLHDRIAGPELLSGEAACDLRERVRDLVRAEDYKDSIEPDRFVGMGQLQAAYLYLRDLGVPATAPEVFEAIRRGGCAVTLADSLASMMSASPLFTVPDGQGFVITGPRAPSTWELEDLEASGDDLGGLTLASAAYQILKREGKPLNTVRLWAMLVQAGCKSTSVDPVSSLHSGLWTHGSFEHREEGWWYLREVPRKVGKPRAPRGQGQPHSVYVRRRQARLRAVGNCEVCGKPSAPYVKCETCRAKRNEMSQAQRLRERPHLEQRPFTRAQQAPSYVLSVLSDLRRKREELRRTFEDDNAKLEALEASLRAIYQVEGGQLGEGEETAD
jgi:hypothetical protein